MSEKRKPAKKKTKAATARRVPAAASAKVKSAKRQPSFFVAAPRLVVCVSDRKPDGLDAAAYATFEEAKTAAIDELVQAIEDAERQLVALKGSTSYDELRVATT